MDFLKSAEEMSLERKNQSDFNYKVKILKIISKHYGFTEKDVISLSKECEPRGDDFMADIKRFAPNLPDGLFVEKTDCVVNDIFSFLNKPVQDTKIKFFERVSSICGEYDISSVVYVFPVAYNGNWVFHNISTSHTNGVPRIAVPSKSEYSYLLTLDNFLKESVRDGK